MAYEMLEPFGPRRDDQRAGSVAAALWNRVPRKDGKVWRWNDVLPSRDDDAAPAPRSVRTPARRRGR